MANEEIKVENKNEDASQDAIISIEELEREKGDAFLKKWVDLIVQNTEQYWKEWVQREERAYKKLSPDDFHKQLFYQHKFTAEKNIEALKKYKSDIVKVLKASLQRIYDSYKYKEEKDAVEWLKNHVSPSLIESAYVKNLWIGNDLFSIVFGEKGLWSPSKPEFVVWKNEYKSLYGELVRALEQGLSIDELMKSFGLKIVDLYVNAGYL